MADVSTATRSTGPARADRLARVRMAALGAIAMLILEFILGMIYNLYGTAPTPKKHIGLFSSPVLALHVVLAILLLIAAVMLLVRAIGARHRLSIWLAAVGLLAIVAAIGAGMGFTGSGSPGASLGMSLAFAVSLGCYVALVFALAPARQASATT